jgi:Dyp-type peroxidase family
MEGPDRNDMQGMLRYGYGRQKYAYYLMLSINDPQAARTWLSQTTFQSAAQSPDTHCCNLAFSASGLQKLGLTDLEALGFSRAFIEGMDTDHRNRTLGDFDHNAASRWEWGNREDNGLHLLLMIFARTPKELKTVYQQHKNAFLAHGLSEQHRIHAQYLQNAKGHYLEHFGFRDGLSQPEMHGTGRIAPPDHMVNPGEFVLGYPNAYEKLPHSPLDQERNLDLGKNGSYLVFRQLEQDVALFWQTLLDRSQATAADPSPAIELAAKMVGRKPGGEPLVVHPPQQANDFRFYEQDPLGRHCPLGSHIRRANPRDSKSKGDQSKNFDAAVRVANRHRILRRGRPYGLPVAESLQLEDIIAACLAGEVQGERGLNFVCFNTDIDRQFEFVQHTWANNPKFGGLYNDVDPIIGVQREKGRMVPTQFEVPDYPVRKRYHKLPAFTRVRGGSYFFLPGLNAIQMIATQFKG